MMTRVSRHHPQLTRDELQQVKWLLGGVLTLLSIATVLYLDVEAWTLMILTAIAVGLSLLRPTWIARVPRWVHRLAFPFVAAFFAGDLWLTGELLPAMVRLDILLLLYRSTIYRQRRDDLQTIVLGLFLIVVAGVLTVSLTFAAHILAFAACALAFLLVITLAEDGGPAAAGSPLPEGEAPAWTRHVNWRRLTGRVREVTDWRVVALGGGLFAGLVVLSALLFLAIPRFQLNNGFFLERFITKKAKTGFSESIQFGDVTEITQDNSVALSVDVSDPRRIPASPYWRMLVLDEYRNGSFRISPRLRSMTFSREFGGVTLRGRIPQNGAEPVFWTFYLESGVSRFLPLIGRYETMQFRERQNYRVNDRLNLVALRDEPVSMTAYRVVNMDTSGRMADRGFAAEMRSASHGFLGAAMLRLGVDEADRATLDRVVREITGGAKMRAEEFSRAAERWLQARHRYSLQPSIPPGAGDPLVRWLDSGEVGHCELFAGSLVLLARAAGLPARVVTGFRGGSWNGYSNNFTLRNSDAHAWCEIFDVAGEAWLRADPTPGAAAENATETPGDAALAQRLDRSWTARLDSLRVFWYRRIVSFDQQSQLETLKAVKEATEHSGRRVREALERAARAIRAWAGQPWNIGKATSALGVLAALILVGWAVQGLRPGAYRWRFGSKSRGGDAVRAEAGRWLQRLRGARVQDPAWAQTVADLQRLRFGARESWAEPHEVFRRARSVGRELRRGRAAGVNTAAKGEIKISADGPRNTQTTRKIRGDDGSFG